MKQKPIEREHNTTYCCYKFQNKERNENKIISYHYRIDYRRPL